ncbi:MAG TPA: hypothetical protein VG796_24760 [Verrucomicrobiales bacterium]|nr:hypothetical protein [Verrucomicrobiales bacterium]
MKSLRFAHPVVAIVIAVLFFSPSYTARAGDSLASREVIGSDSSQLISGSTSGKSVEPGEINEAGAPADSQDLSVWYEWTAAETGIARWEMDLPYSSPGVSVRGVAAYTLADAGAPVTMGNLVPAGAAVLPTAVEDRAMQLWVTAGQKIILRVWTAGSWGMSFKLVHTFIPAATRMPGAVPSTATVFSNFNTVAGGSEAFHSLLWLSQMEGFTTEAEGTAIGGSWYPDGAARWYRWHTSRTGPVRFSVTGEGFPYGTVLVAEQLSAGGAMNLVAGPGKSLTFTPVPNREYLVRVSFTLSTGGPFYETLALRAGPVQAGDEPTSAKPLAPGGSAAVNLAGASPTRVLSLPLPGDNAPGNPDAWFDLGSNLSGPFVFKADGEFDGSIYLADANGTPQTILAGEAWNQDLSFLAEAGRHYIARVKSRAGGTPVGTVSLEAQTIPPPANDRRAAAQVLPADGPVLVYGNATGATVEESDQMTPNDGVRGRTVWYALDRPTSAQPWFVWVLCSDGGGASIFREENGILVNAETTNQQFNLTGSRIWIMAYVNYDAHFILMAGPAVSPGDDLSAPEPLTAGETRFLYTGASTENSPLPDNPSRGTTQWLSWTAPQSGPVVFSTRGSSMQGGHMTAFIYTAALEPVAVIPGVPNNLSFLGEVLSFDAVAGTSYRFALHGHIDGVAAVRLQPGGWESPYDLWMQGYPAWKDDGSLTDPLADADGDGNMNIIEMACGRNALQRDPRGFPLQITDEPPGLSMGFSEYTWALEGAAGSRPFSLIFESSSSLTDWTAEPHIVQTVGPHFKNRMWTLPPSAANSPARFYRLRVSR